MSMHLCGPGLTTTLYKKRKVKITKSQQEELERGWRERNVRLKEMRLPKETFEQYLEWVYGKGKKEKTQKNNREKIASSLAPPPARSATGSSFNEVVKTKEASNPTTRHKEWITGPCTTKQTPTYTGTKIIGIGTMHKSNAVPIFSDEEAKDISRMRR